MSPPIKPIKHILVIRFSAMGDVAMMVPVLKALIEQHPYLKITVLTQEYYAPFFRDLRQVGVFSAKLHHQHKGIFGLYQLSKELKALNIDMVADLHDVIRTNILNIFFFNKVFKSINKGRKQKKQLVKGQIFYQLKTTHQRYADVFSKLGYPIALSKPTFFNVNPLSKSIKEKLPVKVKPVIGIAPFAHYESKMYPLKLMEQLLEALLPVYDIFLFGGGFKEKKILSSIEQKYSGVTSIAGKFKLSDELDIISHLKLMISMDSGNGHIAAFLGKKVITLWGVTHPYAGFSPFNQPHNYALLADRNKYPLIPTSIYGHKFPRNYEQAMASIPIKAIVEKVNDVLKEESLTN